MLRNNLQFSDARPSKKIKRKNLFLALINRLKKVFPTFTSSGNSSNGKDCPFIQRHMS